MFGRNKRSVPSGEGSVLDVVERRVRVEKARAEIELIRSQLSARAHFMESLRVYAGIGGLVTGIAALVGIALSAYQWNESSEATQRVRIEERLDRALALLGNDNPAARLAGVVSLNSFLSGDNPDHASQVLLAFTNTLAIESSVTVRNAIVSTLERADMEKLNPGRGADALKSLVVVSRGLMDEGDLWHRRRDLPETALTQESPEARAASVASAIATLLRKGVRATDMRRIYLAGVDLRNLQLQHAVLDDSILAWSDFSNADLSDASLVDADLASTLFVNTRALRASFAVSATNYNNRAASNRHYIYVVEQMSRAFITPYPPETIAFAWVQGPDFNCADLREADFTGHPLLLVAPNELRKHIITSGFTFRKANLERTKLVGVRAFGVVRTNGERWGPFYAGGEGSHIRDTGLMSVAVTLLPNQPLAENHVNYSEALGMISAWGFRDSNWQSALMDDALKQALTINSTTHRDYTRPCHVE
jgi:uncharacterized protein YjbI with pentapeptide repeats